jgi:hypothetical protein
MRASGIITIYQTLKARHFDMVAILALTVACHGVIDLLFSPEDSQHI